MAHVIERASSGRAKCRGCGERIAGKELRFGERLENPFAEGEMTHWFHLECAAFKRPDPFLDTIRITEEPLDDAERLSAEAKRGIAHPRLSRVNGADRAPTGRAECRSCRTPIQKDAWRVALVFYEDGRFAPAGYIHPRCAQTYFETTDILARIRRFSPKLSDEDIRGLEAELAIATPPAAPPSK
jgi:hypothetical protein